MRFFYFLFASFLVLAAGPLHAADLQHIEQQISDSLITTKITAQYTESKNLNPLKISVSTDKGSVKLSGHVKNKEAFIEALRLAVSTKGVTCVDTEDLQIKRVNTLFTDAYITAKAEAAVLKAKVLDDDSIPLVGINASTTNGVVTLSGDIKHHSSITAIIKRVSALHGVKKVITHLKVKADSA